MSNLSRRSFVTRIAAIPFPVWFQNYAAAQTPRTRYDALSAQGQAMLAKYANAVKTMMKTSEGDPKSWVFHWYTHWVRNDRTKVSEIARIYPSQSPQKSLAQEMWNTCQGHFQPPQVQKFFLPWHRMYVFFFERIVGSVGGDPSFALPYWNYSISNPATHGVLPRQFRLQGDPTFAELYVGKRNAIVNGGEAIDKDDPGALDLDALKECYYERQSDAKPGFCLKLDNGLHGNVHVLVGNNQNMGAVPWAAGDPVFWMHHCNIDRLWASWNNAGRKNPSTDNQWMTKKFVFADGNGNRVEAMVQDFVDIGKLGYTYDRFEPVPSCPTPLPPITEAGTAAVIVERRAVGQSPAVALGAEAVRVTLNPPPTLAAESASLTVRVKQLKADRRLYLVMKNLRAEGQPGVLYHSYLDLPADISPSGASAHHIGVINFFDAAGHGTHDGDTVTNAAARFSSFDITRVAQDLQAKGRLSAKPTLTIAPSGRPAVEAKPVIGEITLVEQ